MEIDLDVIVHIKRSLDEVDAEDGILQMTLINESVIRLDGTLVLDIRSEVRANGEGYVTRKFMRIS